MTEDEKFKIEMAVKISAALVRENGLAGFREAYRICREVEDICNHFTKPAPEEKL